MLRKFAQDFGWTREKQGYTGKKMRIDIDLMNVIFIQWICSHLQSKCAPESLYTIDKVDQFHIKPIKRIGKQSLLFQNSWIGKLLLLCVVDALEYSYDWMYSIHRIDKEFECFPSNPHRNKQKTYFFCLPNWVLFKNVSVIYRWALNVYVGCIEWGSKYVSMRRYDIEPLSIQCKFILAKCRN